MPSGQKDCLSALIVRVPEIRMGRCWEGEVGIKGGEHETCYFYRAVDLEIKMFYYINNYLYMFNCDLCKSSLVFLSSQTHTLVFPC